jgi:hypothetical protein
VHEREPDAGSFVSARFRALHAMKTIKEPRNLLFTDADPRIDDDEIDLLLTPAKGDLDASFERVLETFRSRRRRAQAPDRNGW